MAKAKNVKKNPTVTLKQSKLEDMQDQWSKQGLVNAMTLMFTVLNNKEGYGRKRIRRVFNETVELAQTVNEGYVSIEELQKALLQDIDVTIIQVVKDDENKKSINGCTVISDTNATSRGYSDKRNSESFIRSQFYDIKLA